MEMLKIVLEGYWYHCSFLAWQWESRKSLSGYTDRDDLFSVPKPKEYTIGWKGIHFFSKKAWTVSPTPAYMGGTSHMWHVRVIMAWPVSTSKLATQTLANTWGADLLIRKCKGATLGFMSVARGDAHFPLNQVQKL